jgi:ankyrin repeat protein
MAYNPNPMRKRPREDEEDDNSHQHCPPQKRHENISAQDHARQHNGDQYHGPVNIYQGAASASRSPEPSAVETALESLMFEEMDARYLTIDALLAPSSCRWLLDREEYKRWQNVGSFSEHHGFLWIKGKAGAGKSTLMKFAFNHAEKTRHEGQTVVSFFFNARGAPIERSLVGMYRALLYQILHKIPRLGHLLCKKRTLSAQTQGWSLGVLRSIFQDLVENLASEHLICYVDALDECTDDDVKAMVSFFEYLGESSVMRGGKFHVCFASRHYPHITIERSEDLILEDQDGHKEDIFSYIKKKLKISNKLLKGEMSKQIEDRASGVFLWVVLVVGILNDECSRGNVQKIRSRLKEIPTGLTDLIQDILDRDKPTKYLVPLLQWVLFSRRPLTPEELFLALQSIESETIQDSHTPEALARDNIDKFILNTSKGLAEMTKGKKPKVQFIHELVRTHFLGPEGLVKLDTHMQTHLVGQSHDRLKTCCNNYLMSNACNNTALPAVLPKADSSSGKRLRGEMLDSLPFLQYALDNVLYHTNLAHVDGVNQRGFVESFSFDTWRKFNNAIARYTVHRHTESVSRAYILAEQGCAALLAIAMESQPKPDETNERCRSIIGAAIEARDVESVRAALKLYDREEYLGKDNGILMSLAIESDDLQIVQALVAARAKPYKTNISSHKYYAAPKNNALVLAGSQPDKFASSLGHFGLLRLLFGSLSSKEKVTEPCIKAVQYALEETCKHGDLDMFHLMINVPEAPSSRILIEASTSGNQQLVRSILKTGININSGDAIGGGYVTPLVAASKAGHEHIVQFLILHGADPKRSRSPLVSASAEGHVSIVRILLEYGIDIDAADMYLNSHTALQSACLNGHLEVARLLIQNGAKVNYCYSGSDTPLLLACIGQHEETVQMLLANDADINVADLMGCTPLSTAIRQGYSGIARLLIESGADIHGTCYAGRSALWRAAYFNNATIAQLLIDMRANVNVSDTSGETILAVARSHGYTNIVKLLVENGAVEQPNMISYHR